MFVTSLVHHIFAKHNLMLSFDILKHSGFDYKDEKIEIQDLNSKLIVMHVTVDAGILN